MLRVEFIEISYPESATPGECRQREHDAVYALLYKMLREDYGIENPVFVKNEHGKPYIKDSDIFFSVSHAHGMCACATHTREIGIDIEKIVPDRVRHIRIAKRYFSENEMKKFENADFSDKAFFEIWTAKEACIKRIGTGFRDIKKFDTQRENISVFYEKDYVISVNIEKTY